MTLLLLPGSVLGADTSSADTNPTDKAASSTLDTNDVGKLHEELAALTAMNVQLRDENQALTDANGALQADNSTLSSTVDAVTRERDQLKSSISKLDQLYDPLEADRQLLVELRKDLPDTREEIQSQLERMRTLALASNPSRLGPLLDRLNETAPAFLDWRFTDYATSQDATAAYYSTGANAFDSNMTDFRNAVLLSVANQLDSLLTAIDRTR